MVYMKDENAHNGMICQGYQREPHEVEALHAKGLCSSCYHRKYRHDHLVELQAYQEEYRADQGYRDFNRLYMRAYRRRHRYESH